MIRDKEEVKKKKKESANENNKETEKARENDNVRSRCVGDSQQVWKFNATQRLLLTQHGERTHRDRSTF